MMTGMMVHAMSTIAGMNLYAASRALPHPRASAFDRHLAGILALLHLHYCRQDAPERPWVPAYHTPF